LDIFKQQYLAKFPGLFDDLSLLLDALVFRMLNRILDLCFGERDATNRSRFAPAAFSVLTASVFFAKRSTRLDVVALFFGKSGSRASSTNVYRLMPIAFAAAA
jgi:hypothetical protein